MASGPGANSAARAGRRLGGSLRFSALPARGRASLWLGATFFALFALGVSVAALTARPTTAERTAEVFSRAWARSDYRAMHDLLEPRTRARTDLREFREAYERARATWTAVATRAGDPRQVSHPRVGAARRPLDVEVAISVPTRVFDTVRGSVLLPVSERGVVWSKHLAFPHLRRGERLSRRTKAPPRAPITDRHGTTIVSGPASDRQARTAGAESIAGALERPRGAKEERAIYRRGFPVRTPQGVSGLESMLEAEVAGKPGGVLRAGDRVIASSGPRPARRVTSTVDLDLQGASDRALGEPGRHRRPRCPNWRNPSAFRACVLGSSAPRLDVQDRHRDRCPRGEARRTVDALPGRASRDGRGDAGREFRRRSLRRRFRRELRGASRSHSCNSVFAPLGVRVGAERLVRVARRYGFNAPSALRGAKISSVPEATEIGSGLELASTALRQGRALATPLALASIAQAVGADGLRHEPRVRAGGRARPRRVTTPPVARALARMMVAVVTRGTGQRAALDRIEVAGKTGTAELGEQVAWVARKQRPTPTPGLSPSRPPTDRVSRSP